MKRITDILGLLLVALLMVACSDDGDDWKDKPVTPDQKLVLTFYVYAPEHPVMTRGNEVHATDEENAIHNLQIWVFETGTDTRVGYLAPSSFPTSAEGKVYQMNVAKAFANKTVKPNVDVYVVANASSTTTLNINTTRTQLEAAVMGETDFGTTSPQRGVPEGGLPMTGVLRDQQIGGEEPVLHVKDGGDPTKVAKVRLLRMVSKVRYVFCKGIGNDDLAINGITIGSGLIPTTEYLFLTDQNYRIGSDYNSSSFALIQPTEITDVRVCSYPLKYDIGSISPSPTAQEYEDLISLGVNGDTENNIAADLTMAGPFYFKESDRKLSGKITYTPPTESQSKEITYSMGNDANSTFTRNHSWIVYAYYEGLSGMQVIVVDVTPWEETETDHSVYNW
ncbi:MAG: hypothetical protein J6W47_04025 [Bacteroidales bacterium]|nr:hypothetical protein [Bacteroidales bacterium]